jgi:hypothetical protein
MQLSFRYSAAPSAVAKSMLFYVLEIGYEPVRPRLENLDRPDSFLLMLGYRKLWRRIR